LLLSLRIRRISVTSRRKSNSASIIVWTSFAVNGGSSRQILHTGEIVATAPVWGKVAGTVS